MSETLKIIDVAMTGEFRGQKNYLVETDKGMFGLYDEVLAGELLSVKGTIIECKVKTSAKGNPYILDADIRAVPSIPVKALPSVPQTPMINGQRKGMLFNNAVQLYRDKDYEKVEGVVGYDYILLIAKKLESLADQFDK